MEKALFQRMFTMSRLQKKSQWGQIIHVFSMIMALLSAGERGIMGDWVTDILQTEPILWMFTTSATHPKSLPEMISHVPSGETATLHAGGITLTV